MPQPLYWKLDSFRCSFMLCFFVQFLHDFHLLDVSGIAPQYSWILRFFCTLYSTEGTYICNVPKGQHCGSYCWSVTWINHVFTLLQNAIID